MEWTDLCPRVFGLCGGIFLVWIINEQNKKSKAFSFPTVTLGQEVMGSRGTGVATLGPVYQVPGVRFHPKGKKVYLKLLECDFRKKKKSFLAKICFPSIYLQRRNKITDT